MATYVIGGYSADSILSDGSLTAGTGFMLDPAFTTPSSTLTFTVTDDDTAFSGSVATQLDSGQTVVVTNASSGVVASGPVRLGLASTFSLPSGGTVTLYEVRVAGSVVGYVANGQIQPGIALTVTSAVDTAATGVTYASLASPTYNSASSTNLVGGSGNDSVLAGAGNDTVSTNAGDDYIDGGSGNDSLSGGDGSDTLIGGLGNDTLLGGLGDDVLSGGQGADSLVGDAGNDLFYVADDTGTATVSGGAGEDTLNYSGATARGVNVLFTGTGSGTHNFSGLTSAGSFTGIEDIVGTNFADTVNGALGSGNLGIWGGAGNDSLTGGGGTDWIEGGSDSDTLTGNNGADTLLGGTGNDSLIGGSGADMLDGGSDADTIAGGNDNDTIIGGAGNDRLSGDANNDTFVLADGFGVDTITGGTGTDRIDASGVTTATTLTYGSSSGSGTLSDGTNSASFTTLERVVLGSGSDTVIGASNAEYADGGAGDDSLSGAGGADTLLGGAGNDTLVGGSGSDSLDGGDGDDLFILNAGDGGDTIIGGAGEDTISLVSVTGGVTITYSNATSGSISGAAGNYTFSGIEAVLPGSGNDVVDGSDFADTLYGGAGNDQLSGNDGADYLSGGAGNDTLEGGALNDTLAGGAGADVLYGGTGLDYVDYSASSAAVNVNLRTWVVSGGDAAGDQLSGVDGIIGTAFNDTLQGFDDEGLSSADLYTNVFYGGAGNDWMDGGAGADVLSGGADDDTVQGGAGNDTLTGDDGNDVLSGGTGNDNLSGGTGNDTLSGGDGNDSVVGDEGDDTLTGDAGNDTLSGGTGNDSLSGGQGSDVLQGGDGDDTIVGGAGNDTLSGGDGRNVFALAVGSGTDTILDFNATLQPDGRMVDQVDVTGLIDGNGDPVNWADAVITADASGNAIVTFPGGERIVLLGVTPAQVTGQQALWQLGVPCFTAGTMIVTPQGEVAVEDLRVGDLVMTLDHGPVPILWAGGRHLGPDDLAAQPDLKPIVIRAGAFGPHGEVTVSPQHAILAQTAEGERLVRAKHLADLDDPRFRVARGKRQVAYHHILLAQHGIVMANGLLAESMYPGPMALRALGPFAAIEIARQVPWLAPVLAGTAEAEAIYGPTARPVAKRRGLVLVDGIPQRPARHAA